MGKKITKKERAKADKFFRSLEIGDKKALEDWKISRENRDFILALETHDGDPYAAFKSLNVQYRKWPKEKCRSRVVEILRRTEVRGAIEDALRSYKVFPSRIIGMIERIASTADRDTDRLKALEMLGKWCRIFNEDGKVINVHNNLNISEDAAVRLLERRHKFDTGQGGKFLGVYVEGDTGNVVDGETQPD